MPKKSNPPEWEDEYHQPLISQQGNNLQDKTMDQYNQKPPNSPNQENTLYGCFGFIFIFIILFYIIGSLFEAQVFTKLTGQEVSWWDALWVNLHITQPIAPK